MTDFRSPQYPPPFFYRNGHIATIAGHVLRNPGFNYNQELYWETPDDDFIELHAHFTGSSKLMILLHGLEGNSQRAYIKGMASKSAQIGFDVLTLNFRSCSGKMNRKARFYHSGEIGDLRFVVHKIISDFNYQEIALTGFSLGGNVLLKYLSEEAENIPKSIKSAMAVSVPVDLKTSAIEIERFQNRIYLNRFLRSLKRKIKLKMQTFPDAADWKRGLRAKTFHEFDDAVTAPLHGFRDVADYYIKASSLSGLHYISVPTLLLSAQNDSFLSKTCFPDLANHNNHNIYTCYPKYGGHVGFPCQLSIKETFPERLLPYWLQCAESHIEI